MKFVDYVKIHVRSGAGGNGCCSFRREKFVPRGGPNGGDGGRGGDIVFQGSARKATLLDFHFRRHFAAQRGGHGRGKDQHGKDGESLVIEVPFGTVVRDAATGEVLLECLDATPLPLLRGGQGGRGNTRFKSPTHRAPMECEPGQPGEERWIVLELKSIADVGLVGFPNAGKSTLIGRISRARPKVADYPFTTLTPNLGVVHAEGFESFAVADIPGLIPGAHAGAGLGDRFLRHIERTGLLLLLLDLSELAERGPWEQYETLLEELRLYSPALLTKPRAVALNKADLVPNLERLAPLRARLEERAETVYAISAATGQGLPELVSFLAERVNARRAAVESDSRSIGRTSGSTPRRRAPLPPPVSSGSGATRSPRPDS
jgi:GTP-binding protein